MSSIKVIMTSIRKYFIVGYSRYVTDSAAAWPLSPVLDGVGGGQRLSCHHRPQPPLQEAEHPPHASLGPEHLDPEDAGNTVYAGPQTGTNFLLIDLSIFKFKKQ